MAGAVVEGGTRPEVDSERPVVRLRSASARPYDSAIAAARTCYSPRVVLSDEVTEAQRGSIGPLTFDGGHHTVFQHAHFEFGLENVSRQFVWSFLHSHPFYNSEQSSQRFVRLDEVRARVPPELVGEAREVFGRAVLLAWEAYRRLAAILKEDTRRILGEIRHLTPGAGEKRRKRVEWEAEKKAIEVARYVIPVAAYTSMVHTVSGIVLHRLHRMIESGDTPRENREVVEAMVAAVREHDPDFFSRIGAGPLPASGVVEGAFPTVRGQGDALARELDAELGDLTSRLVDWSPRAEETTADAVRAVLGRTRHELSDDQALEAALNPGQNRYRLETLDLAVHSPLTRALHHPNYTFLKKLSHTADSQDQRHRMVPASRPLTTLTDTSRPDVVVPPLVANRPEALEVFQKAVEALWRAKNELLDRGASLESALYLLPNAKALRFHETGNLLYLSHKWVMRTCFNAQEEIYRASMEEISQVRALHPRLVRHMGPPCVLRTRRITPTCTEGEHFCGVSVWRTFPDVVRRI
jgi:thymidylate synthase ThyX